MNEDGKKRNHANDGRSASSAELNHDSHPSHHSHEAKPLLPPRGDYQTLLSFQKAEVVYDITFRFAHKYLSRGDRTVDQMIQSARSGKQNILEGSKAAQTSKETEIKLTNVGRASLEELPADYRDFLRVRDHVIWDKDSKEARFVRRLGCKTPQTFEIHREFMETRPPEVLANIAICLIHQTNYLIDQQLKTLEKEFIELAFAQRIIIMQPNAAKLASTFLKYLLLSQPVPQRIRTKGTGATVQGIKASLLMLIEISFPKTLAEQQQIVAKPNGLTEDTQRLAAIYQQKLAALEALKKSLLHQAFSGRR